MPIRVYLVDDSPEALRRIEGILHRDTASFEVIGSATSGVAAIRALRHLSADVVLLDLSMPRLNGVEVLKLLRAEWPDLCVVVLTAYYDAAWVAPALAAGANGYVLKTASAGELMTAMRAALAGSFPTSVEVMTELASTTSVPVHTSPVRLTAMEREVLSAIADGHTNQEIAAARFVSVSTVKLVVAALMDKLAARNRTHLISQGIREGLISLRVETR
ncbi:MAG: response regulator transcription factor [Propionibacteriaceae bacterium]|nr:response regulator transcription factor [Propionibacteriaceae bacterium]